MKGKNSLLILALLGFAAAQQRPSSLTSRRRGRFPAGKSEVDFNCPDDFGYYPHIDDCTHYYVCVFGGALLESCTGGLMYSHDLQTCDWPRNVLCSLKQNGVSTVRITDPRTSSTSAVRAATEALTPSVADSSPNNRFFQDRFDTAFRTPQHFQASEPAVRRKSNSNQDLGGSETTARPVAFPPPLPTRKQPSSTPAPPSAQIDDLLLTDFLNLTDAEYFYYFDDLFYDDYYNDSPANSKPSAPAKQPASRPTPSSRIRANAGVVSSSNKSRRPSSSSIRGSSPSTLTSSNPSSSFPSSRGSSRGSFSSRPSSFPPSPKTTSSSATPSILSPFQSFPSFDSVRSAFDKQERIPELQTTPLSSAALAHFTVERTRASSPTVQDRNTGSTFETPRSTFQASRGRTSQNEVDTSILSRPQRPRPQTRTQSEILRSQAAKVAKLSERTSSQRTTTNEGRRSQQKPKTKVSDSRTRSFSPSSPSSSRSSSSASSPSAPFSSSAARSGSSSGSSRRPATERTPSGPVTTRGPPARRPNPVYPQPAIGSPASKCDPNVCVLPDCYCGGKTVPSSIPPQQVPQIVLLTFDDSVNDLNKELYKDLFSSGRKNPNGCPISATFYVSHEWTDYSQVQNLYADGHEMASHSIQHSFGEQFSAKKWAVEIVGQREILSAYGGVKMEDVRGMRAPFLAIGGNRMFEMLYDQNFTYDSSMPVYENRPPSFPYTIDYKLFHDCMIPPCPTNSYPGVWEVPMVMWQDLNGGRCSMGDACTTPPDAEGVYKMLIKNFERHYTTNRAPFGLYYHAAWFTTPHHKEGFIAFLDTITAMNDVWIVTNWQAIQWMRDPVPLSQANSFGPFQCSYPDRPKRCTSTKVCNLWHKGGVRYMRTCQRCPDVYPWSGKTGVKSPLNEL